MSIAAAENFQLKWHSYGAHLHASITTLLRSESFTDVTLATVDGRQISAHRFVLSACSLYLHQLLRAVYPATNSGYPIIIVLPPEINYRILKILIEYMYSGEATVSYEQLDDILKAAHILGIKGLCREKNSSNNSNTSEKNRTGSSNDQSTSQKQVRLVTDRIIKKAGIHIDGLKGGHITGNGMQKLPVESVNVNRKDEGVLKVRNSQGKDERKQVTQNGIQTSSNVNGSKTESTEKSNTEMTITTVIPALENSSESINEPIEVDPMELLVKQEPIEWVDTELVEPMEDGNIDEQMHTEMTIKPELNSGDDDDDDEEGPLYTPLTCDLCQKTFTTPAEWVRHIEAHPENQHSTSQRRRKSQDTLDSSGEPLEFPPLRCELCQEVFSSPGDWVRHIQTSHTEEQLAVSNNSPLSMPRTRRGGRKRCQVCDKTFPSHASMIIHRRTHTGEKPYICPVCSKGFNVKSNLLRHLRTLHDQIVSPSNVD